MPNLHLVGAHSIRETEYFNEIMRTVPHARWDEKVNSWRIGRRMAQASCGLALSSTEGAMFVCGEYSLCGIPVVNTANIGGRDLMLPEFSAFRAEDTPESVAEGVEHWKANPVPPQEIREAFLRMAAEHRAVLDDLLASAAGKRVKVPHKLGIRCRLLPHQKLLHGLLLLSCFLYSGIISYSAPAAKQKRDSRKSSPLPVLFFLCFSPCCFFLRTPAGPCFSSFPAFPISLFPFDNCSPLNLQSGKPSVLRHSTDQRLQKPVFCSETEE